MIGFFDILYEHLTVYSTAGYRDILTINGPYNSPWCFKCRIGDSRMTRAASKQNAVITGFHIDLANMDILTGKNMQPVCIRAFKVIEKRYTANHQAVYMIELKTVKKGLYCG